MLVSIRNPINDPYADSSSADDDTGSHKTIVLLSELLGRSLDLRDLYKNARWQTSEIQFRRLHQLFDRHYKEQLHLVDVLTDRIRTLGGARQLFASKYFQGTRSACALRGNKAANRLLSELLDAHESVMNTGQPYGSAPDEPWARDFAVGQVVLTNVAQRSSISDELADRDPGQRAIRQHAGARLE